MCCCLGGSCWYPTSWALSLLAVCYLFRLGEKVRKKKKKKKKRKKDKKKKKKKKVRVKFGFGADFFPNLPALEENFLFSFSRGNFS